MGVAGGSARGRALAELVLVGVGIGAIFGELLSWRVLAAAVFVGLLWVASSRWARRPWIALGPRGRLCVAAVVFGAGGLALLAVASLREGDAGVTALRLAGAVGLLLVAVRVVGRLLGRR